MPDPERPGATTPTTPSPEPLPSRPFLPRAPNAVVMKHIDTMSKEFAEAEEDIRIASNPELLAKRRAEREQRRKEEEERAKKEAEGAKEEPAQPPPAPPTLREEITTKVIDWGLLGFKTDRDALELGKKIADRLPEPVKEFTQEVARRVTRPTEIIQPEADPNAERNYAERVRNYRQAEAESLLVELLNNNPFVTTGPDQNKDFTMSMQLLGTMLATLQVADKDAAAPHIPSMQHFFNVTSRLSRSSLLDMGYSLAARPQSMSDSLLANALLIDAPPTVGNTDFARLRSIPAKALEMDALVVGYDLVRRFKVAEQSLEIQLGLIDKRTDIGDDEKTRLRQDAWNNIWATWAYKSEEFVNARMTYNLAGGLIYGSDGRGRMSDDEVHALSLLLHRKSKQQPNEATTEVLKSYNFCVNLGHLPRTSDTTVNKPASAMNDQELNTAIQNATRNNADAMARAEQMLAALEGQAQPLIGLRQQVAFPGRTAHTNCPVDLRTVLRREGENYVRTDSWARAAEPFRRVEANLTRYLRDNLNAGPDQLDARLEAYLAANPNSNSVNRDIIRGLKEWFDGVINTETTAPKLP